LTVISYIEKGSKNRRPEEDKNRSQNKISKTGKLEDDIRNRCARIGQQVNYGQDRTTRKGQREQDR
jgi:hypothetical protein